MAFTDRFIKVPIKVYNTEEKNLTGKENCTDIEMRVNPMEIASWWPGVYDDYAEPGEHVVMITKNGDRSVVYLTPKEFEKLLNEHGQ